MAKEVGETERDISLNYTPLRSHSVCQALSYDLLSSLCPCECHTHSIQTANSSHRYTQTFTTVLHIVLLDTACVFPFRAGPVNTHPMNSP